MIYTLNKTNYSDFRIISVSRLKPRSYFIPYPDRDQADSVSIMTKRYESPLVHCLNGTWDFKFYPVPSELPDELDTEKVVFDSIDVPSCWQFRGYDRPFYLNTRYQFPYDPPEIPAEEKVGKVFAWNGADFRVGLNWKKPENEYNFVGVYRTFFDIDDTAYNYVISFLGVASCADVYLNGSFIGYSEGSHNTAEFDISENIRQGKNELLVVVHRWCNGTYLECQDMFRNNGIFRDVLLRKSVKTDIEDISFDTSFLMRKSGEALYDAGIIVSLYGDTDVKVTLSGHGLNRTDSAASESGSVKFHLRGLSVKEWTAESPYLYDLYVETETCCVKLRVGFRDVKIDGTVFKLNGRKLKLHGVNHHDTSPVNGYYMTPDEIERDVKLCKDYNIDTIRTSHYPPDPLLLDLCDELGIYVIDEADVETHGTFTHMLPPSYNRISNDPKWAGHFVDRIKHLYQRDKTHTSIIMWSLGNESGGTFNTDLMYMYLKDVTSLPVHYESVIHTKRKAYDVASEMYPPQARLNEIGQKKYKVKELCDRPYFLCEYAHAMGVGPGGIEEYWESIYKYDNLMGGCVWEMNDHAVLHENGSYTYGGDHGEWEHDRNFCVDGLFYPDRTPSTGARIVRFCYRPLRVRHIEGDQYEIFNTKAFTDGSSYILKCQWSDGVEFELTPDVGPLEKEMISIETMSHIEAAKKENQDLFLTIRTVERATGTEVSCEQLSLYEYFRSADGEHAPSGYDISSMLDISDGKITFNYVNLHMASGDPYTILFRAPTDNDFENTFTVNTMAPFTCEKEKILSVEKHKDHISVTSQLSCKNQVFICHDTYRLSQYGIIVESRLELKKGRGFLPRFGKTFVLSKSFDTVEYYGRNRESYADMKDQAQIERVTCSVSDMTEPNIRPQESGNRCDTRYASISNDKYCVNFTALGKPFELGIKPYSDRELMSMAHREDEKATGTYVTISAFQQGIGTGICGYAALEFCQNTSILLRTNTHSVSGSVLNN